MRQIDDLWQNFIEQEKARLMNLPIEELLALEFFTTQYVDSLAPTTSYGLWHEAPEFRNSEIHSFILMAERKIFFCCYKKYLAGFELDKAGNIVPISDEVLYSYD